MSVDLQTCHLPLMNHCEYLLWHQGSTARNIDTFDPTNSTFDVQTVSGFLDTLFGRVYDTSHDVTRLVSELFPWTVSYPAANGCICTFIPPLNISVRRALQGLSILESLVHTTRGPISSTGRDGPGLSSKLGGKSWKCYPRCCAIDVSTLSYSSDCVPDQVPMRL
jgi:hypothetical protein